MCQAYEGERNFLIREERAEIQEKWAKHESGEAPLSEDEIKDLCVRKLMLDEA